MHCASNIVYGIECALCGLIYVGETRQRLNFRMNDHRSNVNDPNNNKFVYKHFNQPDHSIVSMKVRIIEKIYHPTNDPILSTPHRLHREDFWIRELGTAIPYGCNDKIDGVGILSRPRCSSSIQYNYLIFLLDRIEVMVTENMYHLLCKP